MSKTLKRVSALVLAIAMIITFMPMMQEDSFAAKKAKKPAQVKKVKAKVNGTKVSVSWKKAKKAKRYEVQIKDNSTKLVATKKAKKVKAVFTGKAGTKYTIKVRGVNGKKNGKWSKAVKATIPADNSKAADEAKAAQKAAEDKAAKAEADKKAAEDALKKAEDAKKASDEAAKKAEDAKKAAEEAKTAADKRAAEAEAKAAALEKEKADKEAADAVTEAWQDAPFIYLDSSEEVIAEVQAVIDAYDSLTDDQKALVPESVREGIESDRATLASIEEMKAKKAEVIKAIKATTPANYPTDTNTIEIEGEEYCVMAIDNDANEAKLIKKMPVLDSEGNGMPFDANGSYNWEDSSLRAFMNDKEEGFFKGRDLLYSMSIEKDNNYSISKVVFEDEPVITKTDYTTKDRAMLLDKTTFNGTRKQGARQWAAAWNDNTVSTWLYQTTYKDLEDLEGFVELDGDDEYPHLTALYFDDYDYFNDIINIGGWTVNGIARKFGVCPVVYVSIA